MNKVSEERGVINISCISPYLTEQFYSILIECDGSEVYFIRILELNF